MSEQVIRTPPQDDEAESGVLAAMLQSDKAIAEATEALTTDDFANPRARQVFDAIVRLWTQGDAVDALKVADALAHGRPEKRAEIRDFIVELLDAHPLAKVAKYAEIVSEAATCRRLISACSDISDAAYSQPENVEALVSEAEWKILSVSRETMQDEPTKRLAEYLAADQEEIEEIGKTGGLLGISSGLPAVDRRVHGWEPGQLVVIGAQTGMGKTSLLQHFAVTAARLSKRVLFVSLEMSSKEIRKRIYSSVARVPHDALRTGKLQEKGWNLLSDGMAKIAGWTLEINARKNQTTADIAADARRVAARHQGLDLLVVDYLQYVTPQDFRVPREQQVGRIAKELKDIAGMLGCPIITAVQLNDKISERKDKRPIMGDIRESRGIEHTADIILFGYWGWRHDPEQSMNDYKVIIAKHRQGMPDFLVDCYWEPQFYSIREHDRRSLRAV